MLSLQLGNSSGLNTKSKLLNGDLVSVSKFSSWTTSSAGGVGGFDSESESWQANSILKIKSVRPESRVLTI